MKRFNKLAIVIGHNLQDQGAINYLGETEYMFNRRIGKKLSLQLDDMNIDHELIERPPSTDYMSEVEVITKCLVNKKCDISLHLHFNSFHGKAYGCEVLCADNESSWVADLITDRLNSKHEFKERADDGVLIVKEGHRGYKMCKRLNDHGIKPFILEPTFANHRHKESKFIFEHEDSYVSFLLICLLQIVKREKE